MSRLPTYLLCFASFAAAVAACSLNTKLDGSGNPNAAGGTGGTAGALTGGTGGAPPPPTGVPCEIAQVLASADGQCTSCHNSPPVTGVPMSLVSYADLTAASPSAMLFR